MATVTLSTKGQLVIPREIRDRNGWTAGTRLELEEVAGAVTLRTAPTLAPTDLRAGFALLQTAPGCVDDEAARAAVDAMLAEAWRR